MILCTTLFSHAVIIRQQFGLIAVQLLAVSIVVHSPNIPTQPYTWWCYLTSRLHCWSAYSCPVECSRGILILKNQKILLSSQPIDWFWRNLAYWCVWSLCTPLANSISWFQKLKTAVAAILEIHKIAISQRWKDWFWRHLTQWCICALQTLSANFTNLKIQDICGCHLKNFFLIKFFFKIAISPQQIDQSDKIWNGDECQPSGVWQPIKFCEFKSPRWQRI